MALGPIPRRSRSPSGATGFGSCGGGGGGGGVGRGRFGMTAAVSVLAVVAVAIALASATQQEKRPSAPADAVGIEEVSQVTVSGRALPVPAVAESLGRVAPPLADEAALVDPPTTPTVTTDDGGASRAPPPTVPSATDAPGAEDPLANASSRQDPPPFIMHAPAPGAKSSIVETAMYAQHQAAFRKLLRGVLNNFAKTHGSFKSRRGRRVAATPLPASALPWNLTGGLFPDGGALVVPGRIRALSKLLTTCEAVVLVRPTGGRRIFVGVTRMEWVTQGLIATTTAASLPKILDASTQYHGSMMAGNELLSPWHVGKALRYATRFQHAVAALLLSSSSGNNDTSNNGSTTGVLPTISAAMAVNPLLVSFATSRSRVKRGKGPVAVVRNATTDGGVGGGGHWNSSACGAWPPPAFWWGVHAFDAFPSHGLEDLTNTIGRFAAWTDALARQTARDNNSDDDNDAAATTLGPLMARLAALGGREAPVEAHAGWLRRCVPVLVQAPRGQTSPLEDNLRFVASEGFTEPFLVVRIPRHGGEATPLALPDGSVLVAPALQRPNEVPPCAARFVNEHLAPRVLSIRRRRASAEETAGRNSTLPEEFTFPRAVVIIKTTDSASTVTSAGIRGFELDASARAHLESLGLVIVSDRAPRAERMRIVNNAEVVVTSWGSTASMLALLNAGPLRTLSTQRTADGLALRPGPVRVVHLLHSGYDSERGQIGCWSSIGASAPFPPNGADPSRPFTCEQPHQIEMHRFGIAPAAFVRLPGNNLTGLTRQHVYG